jgi:phospholipid/cholesterol/gamma-HCH transport system substrate-binding protein
MRLGRILALVTVLTLVASGCGAVGGNSGTSFEAEFERAFNLFEGGEVRVLGVEAGSIDEVIVEPGSDRVRVRMTLEPDIEVPADAQAVAIQGALLGERYIQIHPAHTEGPTLEDGDVIPLARTQVPTEFEEAFESLNETLEALDEDEVARLVTNLADTLDGQGEPLGETLEAVRDMITALRQSDTDLVRLARTLGDLNEGIADRADAMGQQFADLGVVAESLASDRADLDRTIDSLLRMIRVLGDVVETHRDNLTADLDTLTSVGRTIERNLDQYAIFLQGQAELFRHAERIIPFDRNWLPVVNHTTEGIEDKLLDRLSQRLVGLCLRLDVAECATLDFWAGLLEGEVLGDDETLCLEPLVPCPEDGDGDTQDAGDESFVPFGEALERSFERVPELGERLQQDTERRRAEADGPDDDAAGDGGSTGLIDRGGLGSQPLGGAR